MIMIIEQVYGRLDIFFRLLALESASISVNANNADNNNNNDN
jgi:hypothetical protein